MKQQYPCDFCTQPTTGQLSVQYSPSDGVHILDLISSEVSISFGVQPCIRKLITKLTTIPAQNMGLETKAPRYCVTPLIPASVAEVTLEVMAAPPPEPTDPPAAVKAVVGTATVDVPAIGVTMPGMVAPPNAPVPTPKPPDKEGSKELGRSAVVGTDNVTVPAAPAVIPVIVAIPLLMRLYAVMALYAAMTAP